MITESAKVSGTPNSKRTRRQAQATAPLQSAHEVSLVPLDPNHIHADTPHAKTVHLPSQGWRYGCSSARTGDDKPRGGTTKYIAHPWNANAGRLVVTQWLAKPCGHDMRASDVACDG